MGEVVQATAALSEIMEMRVDIRFGVGGKMLLEVHQLHFNPSPVPLPLVKQVLILFAE